MLFYHKILTPRVYARGTRRRQPAGFTLMEILVAVAVFAILMTALMGAFNALFFKAGSVEKGMTVFSQARRCLDRMAADLRTVYVLPALAYDPPDFDDDPDPYRFVCEGRNSGRNRLRFAGFGHLPLAGRDTLRLAVLTYYLDAGGTESQHVLRRGDRSTLGTNPPEDITDPVLCENVTALTFTCYDGEGSAHEEWNSEDQALGYATPRAVKISLEVKKSGRTYRFETRVSLPVYREKQENV